MFDPDFGLCRGFNHVFRLPTDFKIVTHKRLGRLLEIKQACSTCGTVRVRGLDSSTGFIVASRYEYPADYVLKGQGRMSAEVRADYRLDLIRGIRRRRRRSA